MQTLFPNDPPQIKPTTVGGHWIAISAKLREILDENIFREWIEPLEAQEISDSEILITLPNMVFYQGIHDNFLEKFHHCKDLLGLNLDFRFQIEGSGPAGGMMEDSPVRNKDGLFPPPLAQEDESGEETAKGDLNPNLPPTPQTVSRALTHHSQLNAEYRFDTFVNGPSNQFAHASCLAAAEAPGQAYNPLFLYGSTGLGKTHLLHAVGNTVLENRRNAVVTYITSERFMNEMIYCLRFNKMWDFRKKYRNCDVLLVDDIQFISGKERTQEEFFHTFNTLYESKNQIIVTSDIFPQDIPDIEERLRNRFQWGLIADIQPPDVEHRLAILMAKAEKQNLNLTQEAAQYIAKNAKGSVRVLEGALRRVAAFASLQGRPLDLELASEVLHNVFGEPAKSLTIETIQKVVSDHFKLRTSDLKSKKRQRSFSMPRQIAMFLSRVRTKASFPEIGQKFGGKDHTTVIHAVKKIEKDKEKDLDLKNIIETLDRKLDQHY